MAGKTIYTGVMIEELKAKLDSVLAGITAQVTELQNITGAVGQTVVQKYIKAGNTNNAMVLGADVTGNQNAYSVVRRIAVSASGSASVKGNLKHSTGAYTAKIAYSWDRGATWTDLFTTTSTSYVAFDKGIALNGKELWIALHAGFNGAVTTWQSGGGISYDDANVAIDGPFLVMS